MTSQQENFIKDYLKHLLTGDAAVFAGAGLSVGAGYVDWRGLLKDIAREIDLEVDRETDLISLAQFHVNERGGRGGLNQKIIEEFKEKAELSDNHKILARLPVHTYWTTNYDSLIEDALIAANKRVDIKYQSSQLPYSMLKQDAIVFKMHGDANHPNEATLTKDDYEQYYKKNEPFITSLSADLISKTFLFVGFSFTDPNLDYILSRVKLSLNNNTRPHYCIIRKTNRKDFKNDADFDYAVRRQGFMISDLKRFQIQSVIVEDYSEITHLFREIELRYKRTAVFISGSAATYSPYSSDEAISFIHNLAKEIIKQKLTVVSGFGLGIGSAVINGSLDAIYTSPNKYSEDQLILRPFPQIKTSSKELPELWDEYRKKMLSFAGIALFVFGNKEDSANSKIINANGVQEEFELATQYNILPIPIGATGYIAKNIWLSVMKNFDKYYSDFSGIRDLLDLLNDDRKPLIEHIPTVIQILKNINK
ncbi:SIR2-like domain-containing protein [Mucilaginibacter gossypiicola]|uniref:NAD(+) hydrolase ThsA n=1 Tax=Mucilaginibacter gossypiicola TaxID=551995 RepID=A0A1H8UZY1_9SPHI|nr:SIR2 family protein [Mucilaginibacter gossypiicola]SEP08800.1 SIR2-like domain-containing protein [Mucilaginibacter gossypiicola]